jgi:hypothetical protein
VLLPGAATPSRRRPRPAEQRQSGASAATGGRTGDESGMIRHIRKTPATQMGAPRLMDSLDSDSE